MKPFQFIFKGNIYFGTGCRNVLQDIIKSENWNTICFVIDQGIIHLPIIKIANQYFNQKDFNRALKIYKEAKNRWPSLVNNTDKPLAISNALPPPIPTKTSMFPSSKVSLFCSSLS